MVLALVVAAASCSKKDSGTGGGNQTPTASPSTSAPSPPSAPATTPTAPSPAAPAPNAASATSAVDICSFEGTISDGFGEPFHAKPPKVPVEVPGYIGKCDFTGPASAEVVNVEAFHASRAHISGFKSQPGAKVLDGVGDEAYFIATPKFHSYSLNAWKNEVMVQTTYANGNLDPVKIEDAQKKLVTAIFAKVGG